MRPFVQRMRKGSLTSVPPPATSAEYSTPLAEAAANIVYRSPLPVSESKLPVYVLNAAAFPDTREVDYDSLLPYVLARLPGEEELLSGTEYEVVFFAGGGGESVTATRKNRPGWGWFIQAYHVLSRAMRKRLQKLYIVHERSWVRILVEMFGTIVSPKFRRKIVHVSTLTGLANVIALENLLIPPSAYLHDRRLSEDIFVPYATGRRAYAAKQPLPRNFEGESRLPRVLRETTTFLLMEPNIKTEGLFRIPPNARLKDIMKEAYGRGQKYIVWKDNGTMLPVPHQEGAEAEDTILKEVDQRDAYSVHLAAALIKAWYADLRQPLFPQDMYQEFKTRFGDVDHIPSLEELTELISPASEWSVLPAVSREILTRHLLPLLSSIASYEEYNKMTPENLAVCFAPALLCGLDQIEDAKISSIIRRVLTAAIEGWPNGLRKACNIDPEAFANDISPPDSPSDYEDPLEPVTNADSKDEREHHADEKHFTGIIMQDNEDQDLVVSTDAPPLPPRPSASTSDNSPASALSDSDAALKRKPAPPLNAPPRYSTIITANDGEVAESPVSYAAVTDGFGPRAGAPPPGTAPPLPPRSNAAPPTTHSSIDSYKSLSGSDSFGAAPPSIIMPKRKVLTSEQVDTASASDPAPQSRGFSESDAAAAPPPSIPQTQSRGFSDSYSVMPAGIALPGLTTSLPRRKPISPTPSRPPELADEQEPQAETGAPQATSLKREDSVATSTYSRGSIQTTPSEVFRKPSWPASERRPSQPINTSSLARAVYPAPSRQAPTSQPSASSSSTLPAPSIPRHRAASPSLLQRMPTFEKKDASADADQTQRKIPRKLNLRKESVEDLRRLYEERTGTARAMIDNMPTRKPTAT